MSGKSIYVVLGASGFIGGALTSYLISSGEEVISVQRSASKDKRKISNIIDFDQYEKVQKDNHIVFNCITSYDRVENTNDEILMANFSLPQRIIKSLGPGSKFINLNTALPKEFSFYTLQKKLFVEFALTYCALNAGPRFVDIKLEHVFGPGQSSLSFCGWLIESFKSGAPNLMLTAGEQLRDFVYIDDVISGLLAVAHAPLNSADYISLGSGVSVAVRDFVQKVRYACAATTELHFGALPYRKNEPMFTVADLSSMAELGWAPSFDVDTGISLTVKAAMA